MTKETDRHFLDHFPRSIAKATQLGAIAAARTAGMQDKHLSDQEAVVAIRRCLNEILDTKARIVIGEGERDKAPMLYIGELVGIRKDNPDDPNLDIAIDPLENTNATANNTERAISVMAVSEYGGLFHAPDMYMEKLVVGHACRGRVSLDQPDAANIKAMAKALKRKPSELTIVVLDRPRNEEKIEGILSAGARVKRIADGDLMPAIAACLRGSNIHGLMGIGAAPEGTISAAGVRCLDGEMQARLWPQTEEEITRMKEMGCVQGKIYYQNELAPGRKLIFCATGVTNGELLDGVKIFSGGVKTHTVVIDSEGNLEFSRKIQPTNYGKIEYRVD